MVCDYDFLQNNLINMETNEHADEWFKLMEEKGYSKHTVFIAGYEKSMEDIIKFTDWVNENAYKYPTNTTTRELLEIYKKNLTFLKSK